MSLTKSKIVIRDGDYFHKAVEIERNNGTHISKTVTKTEDSVCRTREVSKANGTYKYKMVCRSR
jgi:hypothetical protein